MTTSERGILNFHGIGSCSRPLEPGEELVWLKKDLFCRFLDGIGQDPFYSITFDDGNKSDVQIALPELIERGQKAIFFLLVGRVGANGFLDKDDIRELIAKGMEVGLHGRDHVSWRLAGENLLRREIDDAKVELEDITGRPVTSAAIPFGDYGRRAISHLRRAGFTSVYSSDGGTARFNRWFRPRRSMRRDDDPTALRTLFSSTKSSKLVRAAKITLKKLR